MWPTARPVWPLNESDTENKEITSMDPIFEIELEDCPVCRGTGAMQDEQG